MTDCARCADLAAELARLAEALAFEVSRRCLGGTPPVPDPGWGNVALPPPDSASDPTVGARPLPTMTSSLDPRHWA